MEQNLAETFKFGQIELLCIIAVVFLERFQHDSLIMDLEEGLLNEMNYIIVHNI